MHVNHLNVILINKKRKSQARNSILLFNKKDKSKIISDYKMNKGSNNTVKDINIKLNRKNSIYNRPNQGRRASALKDRKKSLFSFFKGNNFSEFELNELEYQEAIKYDKRTFLVYYWSLIRREHLIIHTFFSFNDYNILSIKLSKCIFSIALDFSLNVVFFFDETMRKIYLDYGKYNIIAQIPQAVYSTIISESIDIFLRYLCLTEKEIYKIKRLVREKKKDDINREIYRILRCIKIKFIGYFAFSSIILLFSWYFVSAFCAVYRNTQMILFKDSFFSLFLSLLYPFGLYLIPTSLRIFALKDKKRDSKCMYKLSDFIPLI